jgi:hypothetical protein
VNKIPQITLTSCFAEIDLSHQDISLIPRSLDHYLPEVISHKRATEETHIAAFALLKTDAIGRRNGDSVGDCATLLDALPVAQHQSIRAVGAGAAANSVAQCMQAKAIAVDRSLCGLVMGITPTVGIASYLSISCANQ